MHELRESGKDLSCSWFDWHWSTLYPSSWWWWWWWWWWQCQLMPILRYFK